jgi:hypothetical protein
MPQNVKTVMGVTSASVKTWGGIATALVKTIMGVDNTSAEILVDASSPALFTTAGAATVDSASFTAPANSLIVLISMGDSSGSTDTTITPSLTVGSALTWILQVARNGSETAVNGTTHIHTAVATTSEARTVRVTSSNDTQRRACKIYVITGATIGGTYVDTVGANNEGGSITNDLTTSSITPSADGLLIVGDTDWQALGELTSSDLTLTTANYEGAISVACGYKTTTSGVGVTANLNAFGGGTDDAQHKWAQITIV